MGDRESPARLLGRPLKRGSVHRPLPPSSSSSLHHRGCWGGDEQKEAASGVGQLNRRVRHLPQPSAQPAPALGIPCGSAQPRKGAEGGGALRYSQSAGYSTCEGGAAAPSAEGGAGAGLSAWAFRTSAARGWSGSTTFSGCRRREHSHSAPVVCPLGALQHHEGQLL